MNDKTQEGKAGVCNGLFGCFRTEYRIVRDNYHGFKVQARRWWWPFWIECGFCNTCSTVKDALNYAQIHAQGGAEVVWRGRLSAKVGGEAHALEQD